MKQNLALRRAALGGLFALLAGALALPLRADTAKDKPQPGKAPAGKNFELKKHEGHSAAKIDFGAALEVNLDGLATLGSRIDQARRSDPVCLALAAKELAVAETVSGKQASLTSAELFKEAIELAKRRNQPAELKAVALLVPEADKSDLEAQAHKAEAQLKARKDGEASRSIHGSLELINHTRWYLTIYINGVSRGTVDPYDSEDFYVGQSYGTTYIVADAPGTPYSWSQTFPEDVNNGILHVR